MAGLATSHWETREGELLAQRRLKQSVSPWPVGFDWRSAKLNADERGFEKQ
jgi:hypothetical protein